MKIITWNCNGAFRRKFEKLEQFDADILIIQECENPATSRDLLYPSWASNYFWVGDSKHKGLGVFAKSQIKLERLFWPDQFEGKQVKHFLPALVNGEFPLLAVWTHYNNSPTTCYIGQFWKYMQLNESYFQNIIIAGDFNSNTFWDKGNRLWNHSNVVNSLKDIGIKSLYHELHNEEQGKETKPTFYLNRNINKPYHIDFVFASNSFTQKASIMEIGEYEDWIGVSDHVPMVTTFKD